jgi:hypothetical protein
VGAMTKENPDSRIRKALHRIAVWALGGFLGLFFGLVIKRDLQPAFPDATKFIGHAIFYGGAGLLLLLIVTSWIYHFWRNTGTQRTK